MAVLRTAGVGLRRLVDLSSLGWPTIEADADGLTLGATCTFAELEAWEAPPAWRAAPLLRACCRALWGSFKVREAATVGGNLCLALAASPIAALATALEGTCIVWGADGQRIVPAAAFIRGERRTVLAAGEVLRAVRLPAAALARRSVMRRASLTAYGRSAALLIGTRDDATGAFALTITAATARPWRRVWNAMPARIDWALPDDAWHDDVHGAPDWRQHMTWRLGEEIRRDFDRDDTGPGTRGCS